MTNKLDKLAKSIKEDRAALSEVFDDTDTIVYRLAQAAVTGRQNRIERLKKGEVMAKFAEFEELDEILKELAA